MRGKMEATLLQKLASIFLSFVLVFETCYPSSFAYAAEEPDEAPEATLVVPDDEASGEVPEETPAAPEEAPDEEAVEAQAELEPAGDEGPAAEAEPANASDEEAAPASDEVAAPAETAAPAGATAPAEPAPDEAAPAQEPNAEPQAQPETQSANTESHPAVTLTGSAAGITVTVSAEEGVLPAGARLRVSAVRNSVIDAAVESEVAADGNTIVDSVTLDVTLLDAAGGEIEPNGDVLVTFSNTALEGDGDVSVYRVSDDASTVTEMPVVSADADEQTIVTDHFTIYKVIMVDGNPVDFQNITDATRTVAVGEVIYLYEQAEGGNQNTASRWAQSYFSVSPASGLNITARGSIRTANSYYPYIQLTGVTPGTYTVTYYHQRTGVNDSVTIIVTGTSPAAFYAQLPSGYEGTPAGDAGYVFLGTGEIETSKARTIGASYTLDGSDTVTPPDSLGDMVVNGETFTLLGDGADPAPGTYAISWTGLVCSDGYSVDGQSYSSGTPFWHINGAATLYVGATFMLQDAGETSFVQQGDQQVLEIGGAASSPSLPETKTVDGVEYVFDGWYTDEACTDQAVTPSEVSKTTTFYARYVQEATLTYDANAYDEDGEAVYEEVTDIPEPAAYRVGEEVTVAAPHRTGYAFSGWNTAADGSGTPYAAGSTVTIPEGGITLYAQWTHAQVNVTYYRNNNTNDTTVLNQETADADSQGTIWDSVPTRDGYVFRGWATSRDGAPEYYPGATYETGEENILLYAQWGQVANVSVSVSNNTVVYNGQEQTLDYTNATITLTITAGGTTRTVTVNPSDIPSDGQYEYYSETQWGFFTTRYYVDLHAVDVSGTDAGTYRIPTSTPTYSQGMWGGRQATGRYAPISGGTLTIDRKPITITTPSASKVYDGTPLTADEGAGVTGIVAGETYTFTVTGSQTNPGTSVNTYKLRWDGTAKKSNYAISTDLGSLTVGLVLSYDGNENDSGTAPEPVIVALDDEVVVAGPGDLAKDGYEFVGWNTAADGSGTPYAAGSTITIETVEPITLYAQWELSEFTITYDLNGGSVAEGANPDTYTPISDPITLVNPTREGYAFVGWTGTGLDEPTQAVTIPTGSTGNREYTANWLKIVEVPEGAQLTYNASEQTGVAEGTGYTVTNNTGTDADDYTATATLDEGYIWQLADGSTTTEDQSISWSIAPKPVTVSAIDTGKIYGADDPELEASVTGTFGSDTVSYSISREAGEDVGEYDITVTGTARQGNYLVTFEGGTFTISVREVTVTVTGNTATVVYDGEEKSVIGYEVTIPSGVDFTEADIAYSGTPVIKETNAGTYMMGLDADLFYINNSNYDVTFQVTDGSLEITPAPLTVKIRGNVTFALYDGTEKSVSGYEASIPTGTTFTENDIVFTGTAEAKGTMPGRYTTALQPSQFSSANGNYDVTFQIDSDVILDLYAYAEITADNLSKSYGDSDPELTATIQFYTTVDGSDDKVPVDPPEGLELEYTLERVEGEDVGEYAINVNSNMIQNYCLVSRHGGTFTITPRPVTVTATDTGKTYGDDDPTLEATVEGTLNDDTISYSVSRAEGEDVGEYDITVTGEAEQGNYAVTFVNGTFTISPKEITVTIEGNTDTVTYSGEEQEVTGYEATIPAGVDFAEGDIAFSGEAVAKGTNAGTYDMDLEASQFSSANDNYDVTFEVVSDGSLTIEPKAVTVTATDAGKTYGDADPTLGATVEGTIGSDTVSYSVSRAAGEDAGTYAITPTGAAEQGNYTVTFVAGTFTISPKAVTVKVKGNTSNVTYNGEEQSVEGYTLRIPKTVDLVESDIAFSGTAVAKGTNVGVYTMRLQTNQFSNTNDNYVVTFEIENDGAIIIKQAQVTVTATNAGKTYGDDDPAQFEATVEGTIGSDTVSYSVSRAEGEDAGTYAITPTGDESQGNYFVTFVDGTFTISPKAITVTATDAGKTYGDDDPAELEATVDGLVGSDTVSYSVSRAEGEDVGEYDITVTGAAEQGNYTVSFVGGTFTIDPRPVTVTATGTGKTYGDADPTEFEATVEGTLNDDTVSYDISRAEGEDVGTYTITVTGDAEQGNYAVAFVGGTFTISPREITVTIEGNTGTETYNGEEQEVTGYDVTIPEMELVDGTTAFSEGDISFSGEAVAKGTNAGTYDMGLDASQFSESNDNYTVTFQIEADGSLTIGPKAVTVTATDNGKTYSDDDPTLEATVEGTLNGDTVSYSVTRAEGEDVGTYDITVTGDSLQGNYSITFMDGTFTIDPKVITVSATDMGKTYGDDDPTLEATVDGLVGSDTVSYSVSRAEGEDVGEYDITVTGEESQGNYTIIFVDGTFTIDPKPVTVTAKDASKVYGTSDPTLEATVEGTLNDDTVSYDISRAEGENVGDYDITVTGETEQGNYVVTFVNGTFTISSDTLVVKVKGNTSTVTYNGEERSVTGYEVIIPSGADFTEDDIVFSGTDEAKGTDAGTYDMGLDESQFSETNDNYDVTFEVVSDGSLTIEPKAVTVTASDDGKTYGDADPAELEATVEGTIGSDTVSYSVTRAEGEDVGDYDITPTGDEAQGNYVVTFVGATFTIDPREITVTIEGTTGTETYNGEEQSVTGYDVTIPAMELVDGATAFAESDISFSGTDVAKGTNYGEYPMGLKDNQFSSTNDNYDVTFSVTDGNLSIERAQATVTAQDNGKTYGDDDPDLEATVEGTFGNDTISYSVSRATGENVGEYDITASGATIQGNYEVSYEGATFTITERAVTVTVEGLTNTTTYNGREQSYEGMTISWEPSDIDGRDLNIVFSGTARATGADVGTHYMGISEDDFTASSNYDVTWDITDGWLEIEPLDVTVTITGNTDTVTYDATEQVVEGYEFEADSTLYTEDNVSFSGTARIAETNAGTYYMGLDEDQFSNTNDNFNVTFEVTDGELVIEEAELTVSAKDSGKTYGDADPTLEYEFVGLQGDDTATTSIGREAGQDVGTYVITPFGAVVTNGDGENVNDNYSIGYETATFTISPKAVTVTATDAGKTYGDADPTLEATVEGTVGSDTVSYEVSRAEGEDVGTYAITPTGEEDQGNYVVSFVGGTFTIDAKAITVTIAGNTDTLTYNADEQSVEGYDVTIPEMDLVDGATAFAEGDIAFEGEAVAKGTNVGTYDMGLTEGQFSSTNDNYAVTFQVESDGQLEITRAPLTITANKLSYDYNGEDQGPGDATFKDPADIAILVSVDGLKGNDAITSIAVDGSGRDVGEYDLVPNNAVVGNATGNYEISYANNVMAIEPLKVTVTITGSVNSLEYDGEEHQIEGYEVEISDELYTESDIDFSGTAVATGTDAGTYAMSLDESQFSNTNYNFDVAFDVADGQLEITPATPTLDAGPNQTATVGDPVSQPAKVIGVGNDGDITADFTITYTSSDESVATVDENGNVTIVGEGTATITATVVATSNPNYELPEPASWTLTAEPVEFDYYCAAGNHGTWTKGSDSTLDFTFKRTVDDGLTFERFTGILVDGQAVDPSNYVASAGSVDISLSAAYLETLAVGDHTITATFEDGEAEASFTVVAKGDGKRSVVPKTADPLSLAHVLAQAGAGLALVAAGALRRRRDDE